MGMRDTSHGKPRKRRWKFHPRMQLPTEHLFRVWDNGQRHLAEGRYIAARGALEAAEAIAWRTQDAQSLARLYLPLLEARRLIRYQAAEGRIEIDNDDADTSWRECVKEFLFLA